MKRKLAAPRDATKHQLSAASTRDVAAAADAAKREAPGSPGRNVAAASKRHVGAARKRKRIAASPAPALVFLPVDAGRWKDFERLFESRGGPSYCWCMAFRTTSVEAQTFSKADRKDAMRTRVRRGVPIGLLGYLDDEPVAWCSIAPRTTYQRIGGVTGPGEDPERIWSLACFFVKRELRSQGVMRQLLQAAVEHAQKNGATALEAYPVDPDSPSYRFMGFVPTFEAAGFREVGREGSRRHVMRLELR